MLTATFMFVPAHDASKVAKALASPADAVILDLEDGVPDEMKAAARDAAARTVRDHAAPVPQLWVRVNAFGSPDHEADLRAIDWRRAGLLISKAEDSDGVRGLATLTLSGLIFLIESAAGFAQLNQLTVAAPVRPRLAIGTGDLLRDFGLPIDDPAGLDCA